MKIKEVMGYAIDEETAKSLSLAGDYDCLFVASTDVVDHTREIIDQGGWDLEIFRRNPVMLACHLHRSPDGRATVIGNWPVLSVADQVPLFGRTGKALVGGAKFARDESEMAAEYARLYEGGFMRAVSVGFEPVEGGREKRGGQTVYVHRKQRLIEISAVAVGANQEALARSLDMAADGQIERARQEILNAIEGVALQSGGITPEQLDAKLDALHAQIAAEVLNKFDDIIALMPDGVGERDDSGRHAAESDLAVDPASGARGPAARRLAATCEAITKGLA